MPGITFDQVAARWDWRPIPGCPGRHKLSRRSTPPLQIVGAALTIERYEAVGAKDPVLVVRLDGGGLISYQQADGTFVHTLGDAEGFQRKLTELGIPAAAGVVP
jgi:hypothetical protein